MKDNNTPKELRFFIASEDLIEVIEHVIIKMKEDLTDDVEIPENDLTADIQAIRDMRELQMLVEDTLKANNKNVHFPMKGNNYRQCQFIDQYQESMEVWSL